MATASCIVGLFSRIEALLWNFVVTWLRDAGCRSSAVLEMVAKD